MTEFRPYLGAEVYVFRQWARNSQPVSVEAAFEGIAAVVVTARAGFEDLEEIEGLVVDRGPRDMVVEEQKVSLRV